MKSEAAATPVQQARVAATGLLRKPIASADALETDRAALALLALGAGGQAVGVDAAEATAATVRVEDTLSARRLRIFDTGVRLADLTERALAAVGARS